MADRRSALHDHDAGDGLIPVGDARARVLEAIAPLAPLQLPLTEAHGCVSAEDVIATHSLPAFPSSAMDGYAVRSSDVAEATPERPAELKVVGRSMIGHRPEQVVGGGEAIAIATGAPIPAGADTIVPIENAQVHGEVVRLLEAAAAGRHVRPVGEDVAEGTVLVEQGKRLGAPELGLLANAGHATPLVHPRPRV
ncbi:MAG TPA: molybdopterin molybdenumtransferase MoeA, partial [Actinomycetota bacterium]|nr:molybdopterin molybdenumtransferase MoeA [Actinomycetota bacterium]